MWLEKIGNFIKENNISKCRYHTWRDLEEDGEKKGEIRVLVLKDEEKARVEYCCPECGKKFFTEEKWKRPFSVKCENCGNRIKVPRIKDKVKRETKKR